MDFDVGAWIKRARENAGLTQEELAHHLGLSTKASVSAYETGKQIPNARSIIEIVNLCKMPFNYPPSSTVIGTQFGTHSTISGGQNDFRVMQNVTETFVPQKPFAILSDDSMYPVLPKNTEIWLEIAESIQSQKIYYIEYGGEKMYRQLFKLPENRVRIKPYNTEFDEFIVDVEKIRIIGRVSEWHVKNQ